MTDLGKLSLTALNPGSHQVLVPPRGKPTVTLPSLKTKRNKETEKHIFVQLRSHTSVHRRVCCHSFLTTRVPPYPSQEHSEGDIYRRRGVLNMASLVSYIICFGCLSFRLLCAFFFCLSSFDMVLILFVSSFLFTFPLVTPWGIPFLVATRG